MQQLAPIESSGAPDVGAAIYSLAARLFPICRSITGSGVRDTLRIIGEHIDVDITEVPSGTAAFDWTIPPEWNLFEAYIANERGERIVDAANSNLHVMSYSTPVRGRFPLDELAAHIFTLPDRPTVIPYRTSYYAERWGFCMTHDQFASLAPGFYEVVIDSTLAPGSLTYGECVIPGETEDEVLLSAHICHPSLANDNCSGLALLTMLAAHLAARRNRLTYRFVFAPGSIGAIAWLANNETKVDRVKHGLVVSCVGDGGGPTYKRSRRGNSKIDRAMAHVLKHATPEAVVQDFSPYGYDERQYCSPGFDLPVGLFQRSQYGTFPEYHTSADNLDFIAPEHLARSFDLVSAVIHVLERDRILVGTNQKCEPALGRRGLYATIGGTQEGPARTMAMLWTLNLADGRHSLLDMAERAGMPFSAIEEAAERLLEAGLLSPA